MYRSILPYSSRQDHSDVQGHHDTCGNGYANHLRRSAHYPLTRAIHSGARRVRRALSRPAITRSARPSMGWWD